METTMRIWMLLIFLGLGLWAPAALGDSRGITHNKAFLEAFLTRCVPAAHTETPIVADGMTALSDDLAAQWLQGHPGTVWKYDDVHDVLVASDRADHCFVVSKFSDVDDLRDRVAAWFTQDAAGFSQDTFETKAGGEFRASYTLDQGDGWARRLLIQARPVPESGGIAIMGTAGMVLGK